MKIFLTGGRGMVGKNVRALAECQGFEVFAPGRQELDLLDYSVVVEYLEDVRPDLVIHAAGLVGGIQANMASPFDFCFVNVQLGLNVVRASLETGVTKLFNLGSSCMYPRAAVNPLKESSILTGKLEPTNEGYAIAKITTARLCDYVGNQYGVSYKTLIPCNLFGCWDKFDPSNSHMIPSVIRKLHEAKVNGAQMVDVWGDGTARREFMFAEDLADFILYAQARYENVPSLMNVGLGFDYSINEYYQAVANIVGYSGEFSHDLTKPTGMQKKLVDVSEQVCLGWSPKTELTCGLQKTYDFFLKEVI